MSRPPEADNFSIQAKIGYSAPQSEVHNSF